MKTTKQTKSQKFTDILLAGIGQMQERLRDQTLGVVAMNERIRELEVELNNKNAALQLLFEMIERLPKVGKMDAFESKCLLAAAKKYIAGRA